MTNRPPIQRIRPGTMTGFEDYVSHAKLAGEAAKATEIIHGPSPDAAMQSTTASVTDQLLAQAERDAAQTRSVLEQVTGQAAPAATATQPPAATAIGAATPVPPSASGESLKDVPKVSDILGQSSATSWLQAMEGRIRLRQARAGMKLGTSTKLGAAFFGPDGVGKVLTARVYAAKLHELGVVKNASVYVIDLRRALEDGEDIGALVDKAKADHGVIFFDNLQALNPVKNRAETKLIADLVGRDDDPVILVGGSPAARQLVDSNWRLKQAFTNQVQFKALAPTELRDIFVKAAQDRGYTLDDDAKNAIFGRLRGFGRTGASTALTLLDKAEERLAARLFPADKPAPTYTDAQLKALTAADLAGESPFDANGELKSLKRFMKDRVGQEQAKQWASDLANMVVKNIRRQAEGKKVEPLLLNGTVEGDPGTGKTTLIEFVNDILTQLGIRNGKIIYKTASEVKGKARGEAETIMKALFDEGEGGIIVIDEAHVLCDDELGHAALKAGVPLSLNYSETTSLFFLGYDLKRIYDVDPGWNRRIPQHNRVLCESFTRDQLRNLIKQYCTSAEYALAEGAIEAALFELDKQMAAKDFGNAGAVNNVCQGAIVRSGRRPNDDSLLPEDFGTPQRPISDVVDSLSTFPGTAAARELIQGIADQVEDNRARDVAVRTGINPFTQVVGDDAGVRTNLAYAMASIYSELGVIGKTKPQFIDALTLKAGFTGQTRDKVAGIVNDCLGGMMVLRNLAAFVKADDQFRGDAVGGLKEELKAHAGKLTLLLSGTAEEIQAFLALDPELANIITERVELPALDAAGAVEQFRRLVDKDGYELDAEAQEKLASILAKAADAPGWQGVASVEALFRRVKTEHSTLRRQPEFADRSPRMMAGKALTDAAEAYVINQYATLAPDLGRHADGGTVLPGVRLLPGNDRGQPAAN